jgi:hypothetical protein
MIATADVDLTEPLWHGVALERKTLRLLQGRTDWHGLLLLGLYAALVGMLVSVTLSSAPGGPGPTPARVCLDLCRLAGIAPRDFAPAPQP